MVCGVEAERLANDHPQADGHDVESARGAADDCGLFPARARTLAKLASRGLVWADCEALERRRNLGRGTLVVLDVIPESGTPIYAARRALLDSLLPCDPVFDGNTSRPVPSGAVLLVAAIRIDSQVDALTFYQRLCSANHAMGWVFSRAS